MIKLSVALVTRNRPAGLRDTLESVRSQTMQPFEIIVSDDSDNESAMKENREIAEQLRCLYLTGPKTGLYANRNFAARHSSGTHIRTMDDDHTFPPNHFEVCLKKVEEDPGSIWIIGEYSPKRAYHEAPHPCPGELHPRGFAVQPQDTQNCRAISCGASIYPKDIISKGILNNEFFKFGKSFLEYGSRLKYLGYRIRHLQEAYIFHKDPTNRSHSNENLIAENKMFGMLSLSFLYEKSLKNKALTIMEIGLMFLRKPALTISMLGRNVKRLKKIKAQLADEKQLWPNVN